MRIDDNEASSLIAYCLSCGRCASDAALNWTCMCACAACECVVFGGRTAGTSAAGVTTGVSGAAAAAAAGGEREDGRQQGGGGVFTSPNHPRIYPTNVNCVLYSFVAASSRQIVEITFDDFDLQIPATSKSEPWRCCAVCGWPSYFI